MKSEADISIRYRLGTHHLLDHSAPQAAPQAAPLQARKSFGRKFQSRKSSSSKWKGRRSKRVSGELAKRFPRSTYAPSSHWRAAWLNYRIGQYAEAARLFDEQIAVYAGGKEIPAALYWRGKVYEEQERKPEIAARLECVIHSAAHHMAWRIHCQRYASADVCGKF